MFINTSVIITLAVLYFRDVVRLTSWERKQTFVNFSAIVGLRTTFIYAFDFEKRFCIEAITDRCSLVVYLETTRPMLLVPYCDCVNCGHLCRRIGRQEVEFAQELVDALAASLVIEVVSSFAFTTSLAIKLYHIPSCRLL